MLSFGQLTAPIASAYTIVLHVSMTYFAKVDVTKPPNVDRPQESGISTQHFIAGSTAWRVEDAQSGSEMNRQVMAVVGTWKMPLVHGCFFPYV